MLTVAFMLFTVIGTLSHEYGHVIVAQKLGYNTTLHYGSMNYNSNLKDKITEIYIENKTEIDNETKFEQKTEFENGTKKLTSDNLLISIGGPLQTILTGIIGLSILFWQKEKRKKYDLKLIDWLAIFLSLFWLREAFNFLMSIGNELVKPNGSYFGGDEKMISELLNLPIGTISILLGTLGIAISTFIIVRIVPTKLRITFILSGLIGGISGYILWMNILGPKILP